MKSNHLDDNPFRRLTFRGLLLWGLVCVPLGLATVSVATRIFDLHFADPAVASIAINGWLYGSMLLWIVWKFARYRVDVRRLIRRIPRGHRWLPTIGIMVAAALFSLGSLQIVLYFLSFLAPDLVGSLLERGLFGLASRSSAPAVYLISLIITIVAVAPVVEEVLFRGVLLHRWTLKWGLGPAVVVSSLVFGIGHNVQVVGATVFGVVMALLYSRTRTLIIPIVFHVLNNATVVLAGIMLESLNLAPADDVSQYSLEQIQDQAWIGTVLVVLTVPWLARFAYRNWPGPDSAAPYFALEADGSR